MTALAGRLPRVKRPALGVLNVVLLLAVAGLGAASYLALRTTTPTARGSVRTAPVSRGVVLESVSATGALQPASEVGVDFLTAGRLVDVAVKVGQHVRRGQLLGRLDPTDDQAAVDEAVAALATAKTNLAQTIQGETPLQRSADAVSLQQSKAQIATAQVGVVNAEQQARQDRTSAAQALAQASSTAPIVQASSTASIQQAERQLRTDQGNERAAVAKLHADQAQLTSGGTTYPTAAAAVTAATNTVQADQARQQADQVANLDLQAKETADNQRLAADKAALAAAQAANDASSVGIDTGFVNNDQDVINADALQAAQLQKTMQQDGYTLSQDQSTLSTFTSLEGTLTADQSSIVGDEAKIVADRTAIANAKTARTNAIAAAKTTRTNAIAAAKTSRTSTAAKDAQAIQSAKLQVASAKLAYRAAVTSTAVKQAPPTPATLMQGRAAVLQAQVSLASARRTLAQTILRAPEAGTIAAVGGVVGGMVSAGGTSNAVSSSSSSSSGSGSSSGGGSSGSSSYVTLIGQGMQASAEFSESDATNIRVGQPATVTVSALPDEELAAHVISVSPLGSSSSGVVEYAVLFALDRTEPLLKSGMSANVSVTVAERDNVLNVPSAAVTGSGANARVTVDANGVQKVVSVVAGLKGDTTTEIASGLTAGQQVVTSTGATLFSSGGLLSGTGASTTSTTGGAGGGLRRIFGGGGGFGGFGGGG